jgi:hypothetical protein
MNYVNIRMHGATTKKYTAFIWKIGMQEAQFRNTDYHERRELIYISNDLVLLRIRPFENTVPC